MGTTQSYGDDPTKEARIIDSDPQCKIYASKDEEQFQKYIVTHDGSQKFQNNYQFRIENRHNDFVDVLYIGPVQSFMGCTERSKYEVVTQRIPYKLSSLTSIKPKNSLTILKTALRGFRTLYQKHGPIGIKQSMIGINCNKKVKIWLNQNYATNSIEDINASFEGVDQIEQEREMVHCIFDLICSKTDSDDLWIDLLRLRESTNPKSFDQALNMVDYFAGKHRIVIEDTVKNLFNKIAFQPETPSHLTHSALPEHQTPIQPYLKNSLEGNNILNFSQRQQRYKVQGRHINQISTAAIPQQSYQSHLVYQSQQPFHQINNSTNEHRVSIPQPLHPVLISGIPIIHPIANTVHNNGFKVSEGKPSLIKIKFNHSQQCRVVKQQFPLIVNTSTNIEANTSRVSNVRQAPLLEPEKPISSTEVLKATLERQSVPILISDNNQQEQDKRVGNYTEQAQAICKEEQIFEDQPQIQRFLEPKNEVQVQEVLSIQSPRSSIHQQLTPLIDSQSQKMLALDSKQQNCFNKDSSPNLFQKQQQSIVQNPIRTQDNFRIIVNPQLVDTRQIKQSLSEQRYENNFTQKLRPNMSYKQMRKWLQQELKN